jgi:hypothetical protein
MKQLVKTALFILVNAKLLGMLIAAPYGLTII